MSKVQTGPETHIITDSPRCPICSLPANVYLRKAPSDLFDGSCERCGEVSITRSAIEEAQKQDKQHLVSAWLRRRPASEHQVTLEKESVARILKDIPEYSVLEKLDLTLVQIERMSDFPGQRSNFGYERDYPLVYAKTHNETRPSVYRHHLRRTSSLRRGLCGRAFESIDTGGSSGNCQESISSASGRRIGMLD